MQEIRSYWDLLVWEQAMQLAASDAHTRLAQRGALRPHTACSEGGQFCAGEYCRRIWKRGPRLVRSVPEVAQGSLKELETHLFIAERVEIAEGTKIADLLVQSESVGKLLGALIRKLPPD